ncbi:MAG: hypothetical protein ACTSPM_02910 [Candidatus Heimdallarchaeota archaeon]
MTKRTILYEDKRVMEWIKNKGVKQYWTPISLLKRYLIWRFGTEDSVDELLTSGMDLKNKSGS